MGKSSKHDETVSETKKMALKSEVTKLTEEPLEKKINEDSLNDNTKVDNVVTSDIQLPESSKASDEIMLNLGATSLENVTKEPMKTITDEIIVDNLEVKDKKDPCKSKLDKSGVSDITNVSEDKAMIHTITE